MNYNYTAYCWFPTSSNILILPSEFWQIGFESCWLHCSKCRILVLFTVTKKGTLCRFPSYTVFSNNINSWKVIQQAGNKRNMRFLWTFPGRSHTRYCVWVYVQPCMGICCPTSTSLFILNPVRQRQRYYFCKHTFIM